MLTNDQIDQLLSEKATVIDANGDKVGSLGQIFMDNRTGKPAWASVNTGLFGLSESFVPLEGASLSGDVLNVPYTKDQIKDAPNIDEDGQLDADDERRLYEHYSFNYDDHYEQDLDREEHRDRDLDRDRVLQRDRDEMHDREDLRDREDDRYRAGALLDEDRDRDVVENRDREVAEESDRRLLDEADLDREDRERMDRDFDPDRGDEDRRLERDLGHQVDELRLGRYNRDAGDGFTTGR